MARTADLGWCVARCGISRIDGDKPSVELTIMEPEGEDSPARSMRIDGAENLAILRDLILDTLQDFGTALELEKED